MADWTAPFQAPHVTTEEFKRMQAEYVAKYGYRYSIPGFDDIIHMGWSEPMSDEEKKLWRQRKYSSFSSHRFEEIKAMKERKRQRYLDMLGSPSPHIFNNRGSLITALDNTQDALSTIAALGTIAVRAAPRVLGKVLTGPLGWVMGGAEVINLATTALSPERKLMEHKRAQDATTELNPLSAKARAKNAERLKKGQFKKGTACEVLQTTDAVFGLGISLGAIMNLPIDIISGAVRRIGGAKVEVNYPVPSLPKWASRANEVHKSNLALYGIEVHTDYDEMAQHFIASNLAAQCTRAYWDDWNPLEQIDDLGNVEIEGLKPTDELTLEVINEIDPDGINAIGWPCTNERWSTMDDLSMASADNATKNINKFCKATKRDWQGFEAAINAVEGGLQIMDMVSSGNTVEIDYTAHCKTMHATLNDGKTIPPDIEQPKMERFINWLDAYESKGISPTLPETYDYAKHICGFEFIQTGAPS